MVVDDLLLDSGSAYTWVSLSFRVGWEAGVDGCAGSSERGRSTSRPRRRTSSLRRFMSRKLLTLVILYWDVLIRFLV